MCDQQMRVVNAVFEAEMWEKSMYIIK